MAETVETLAERLDRLEKVLEHVTLQLSWLVDELVPNTPQHAHTQVEDQRYTQEIGSDKVDYLFVNASLNRLKCLTIGAGDTRF